MAHTLRKSTPVPFLRHLHSKGSDMPFVVAHALYVLEP